MYIEDDPLSLLEFVGWIGSLENVIAGFCVPMLFLVFWLLCIHRVCSIFTLIHSHLQKENIDVVWSSTYTYPSPIHKSINKIRFDWLVRVLNIIKSLFVPFLSKSPQQAQRNDPPRFFPFFPHKGVMSTQQIPSNWRMHHPLYSKMRINQGSHHSCFGTM